jgi:hypothetical protein
MKVIKYLQRRRERRLFYKEIKKLHESKIPFDHSKKIFDFHHKSFFKVSL